MVDDGSRQAAPEVIREWIRCLPLNIVRQPHAGISAARNRGIQFSKGSTLLFVDADCRLQTNCLTALKSTLAASPQHDYFQLHLIGGGAGIVGRSEELRLITLQSQLLQTNGCIRYLNTAGFAIRRTRVNIEEGLFDAAAIRAEDTLLLAKLMRSGTLPFFAADAIVQHVVTLSVTKCLRKEARSACLERRTYDTIASKGVSIRVTHSERLGMLLSMWKTSERRSIGRSAWILLTARQALRLMVRLIIDVSGIRPPSNVSAGSH